MADTIAHVMTVFVKDGSNAAARYTDVGILSADNVAKLVKRVLDENIVPGAHPSRLDLFLAQNDEDDEPSPEQEAAALRGQRLQISWKLEKAGVRDNSFLLACMTGGALPSSACE